MTDFQKFKPGDHVSVNRPDPASGISHILSQYPSFRVVRIETPDGKPARVYLDASMIPSFPLSEVFVYDNEVDLVTT